MDQAVITTALIGAALQPTFDAAVVIPTILKPSLARAVQSVFSQNFPGRIHILVGVDRPLGDPAVLDKIRDECPSHCALTILDLGYSTSGRNGGLYPGGCGGAIRTLLSYAANSHAVAYLDDDNWFGADHLRTLRDALDGYDYAFSKRWYVDHETLTLLCVDDWESLGPGVGAYQERFGGFVDPNSLMIDKLKCDTVLRWWCYPLPNDARGMSEDRNLFDQLNKNHRGRETGLPTSYYVIHPDDYLHPLRLLWIKQKTGQGRPAER